MNIVQFAGSQGFQIQASRQGNIRFVSDASSSVSITGDIRINQWYIASIATSLKSYVITLRTLANQVIGQLTAGQFFPLRYQKLSFNQIFVGIRSDTYSNPFYGSIRNLKMLQVVIPDSQIYSMQFIKLFPSTSLMVQILMNTEDDLINTSGLGVGSLVGIDQSSLPLVKDFMGIWWCWEQKLVLAQYIYVGASNFALKQYTMNSGQYSTSTVKTTTVSLWIYRQYGVTPKDEVLFKHDKLIDLSFFSSSFSSLTFTGRQQTSDRITTSMRQTLWYYIQAQTSETQLNLFVADNNGKSVFASGNKNYQAGTVTGNSNTVTIGQNFQGYIRGVKYYKTYLPNQVATSMNFGLDSDTNLIFYFLINKDGYDLGRNIFTNYAQSSFSSQNNLQVQYGSVQFDAVYWYDMNANNIPTEGTVNQTLTFDGYTCINNKTRMMTTSTSGYANSQFQLSSNLYSYTVEFWIKIKNSLVGTIALLTLAEYYSQQSIVLMVRQEGIALYCYPFINNGEKVQYNDYSTSISQWQHISCSFDGNSKNIVGTYYYNKNDFIYSMTSQYLSQRLQAISYLIQVNQGTGNNPLSGFNGAFYQEVRVWNTMRSATEIQNQRFNELDITSLRNSLLSYMKLMNGGFEKSTEIDFADPSLSKQVQFSKTTWSVNTEILVCPLGYFHFSTSSQSTCYRDGVQGVTTYIYKSASNYSIQAYNLTFKSSWLQQYQDQYFDKYWQLNAVLTKQNNTDVASFPYQLNPQKKNSNLVFSYSQVATKLGVYNISYVVIDKNMYQSYFYSNVILKTMHCLVLTVDNQPEDYIYYYDISTSMNNVDGAIPYSYQNCNNYIFDSSQASLAYVNNSLIPSRTTPSLTASNIIIPSKDQQYLIYGQFQYISFDYAFKNTYTKDVISYRKIIGLRFAPNLVVLLGAYNTKNGDQIFEGTSLFLDATGTQVTNQQSDSQLIITWSCPGSLASQCNSNAGKLNVTITYDQFLQSNLEPFTYYTFTVTASLISSTYGIFKTLSQSVKIVWIPYIVKAQIIGPYNPVASQINIYEFTHNNTFSENQISFSWYTIPSIDQSYYMNSNNRWQFVLNQNAFNVNTPYQIVVNLTYASNGWSLWNGTYSIMVLSPPSGGTFTITPQSGTPYQTNFVYNVSNYKTTNPPLRYQFCYQDPSTGNIIPLSPKTNSSNFTTLLPPSISTASVIIFDSLSQYIIVNASVTLQSSVNSDQQQSLAQQSIQQASQNNYQAISKAILVSSSIPSIIQSSGYINTQYQLGNITQSIYSQVQNFDKFPDNASKYFFLKSTTQVFNWMTTPSYNLTNVSNLQYLNTMQDSILGLLQIQQSQYSQISTSLTQNQTALSQTIFGNFLQDKLFNQNFIQIQSNLLKSLQTQYLNGSITEQNYDIGNITAKTRQVMILYEKTMSQLSFEGYSMQYDFDELHFKVMKEARYNNDVKDQQYQIALSSSQSNQTSSDQISYFFPLSSATQPTERQGLSIIVYKSSPFFGTYDTSTYQFSNQSVYFAYRDKNGNYLGQEYLNNKTVSVSIPFTYDEFYFLPNVTLCSYQTETSVSGTWQNSSCLTSFDRQNRKVTCSCLHMSTYAVIQKFIQRPLITPLLYLQFTNWPSFAVFLYLILVFILGVIFSINKDLQDFRILHQQEESTGTGMPLEHDDSITLNSIAFKRQVFYMSFAADFNFKIFFKIVILQLHPLLQLSYKMDPQIPRLFKFLVLFTRMMILLAISFFCFKDYPNFSELSSTPDGGAKIGSFIAALILLSILFIPLPILLFACFKNKYFVNQNKDALENEVIFEDVEKQQQIQRMKTLNARNKVYIDPTIPIRLLFLINMIPLAEMEKEYQTKIPYASGTASALGKKLSEFGEDVDEDENNQQQESENSNRELAQERETNRRNQMAQGPREHEMVPHNLQLQQQAKQVHRTQAVSPSLQNSQKQDYFQQSQYRTHIQGRMNPGIVEEKDRDDFENIDDSEMNDDRQGQRDQEEEEKYQAEQADDNVNKTESKMIEPSQINIEVEDDQGENVINDDDSEYKEGGESEDENEGNQNVNKSKRKESGPHNTEMQFERNSRNPTQVQQNNQRQESSASSSESDTTLNTQDYIVNKKELQAELNFIGRLIGIILLVAINGFIIYIVSYFYVKDKYQNAQNQQVWVLVFFLSQIIGFFITDFIALFIMATSVAGCCRKKKTCLALAMRETLIIYEDYKFVYKLLHTEIQ